MNAKLTRLSCSSCGAPLAVSDLDLSVVCSYCRSQQQLGSDSTQSYALHVLDQKNQRLRAETKEFRLRNELRRLDEAWGKFAKRFSSGDGQYELSDASSIFLVLLSVVSSVILGGSYGPYGLIGALFVTGFLGSIISHRNARRRATKYDDYRSRYQRSRSDLLEKIQAVVALRSTFR